MIVYSASPARSLVVYPGERIVYGENEHQPCGFGTVEISTQGQLLVNQHPVDELVIRYNYVRKVS